MRTRLDTKTLVAASVALVGIIFLIRFFLGMPVIPDGIAYDALIKSDALAEEGIGALFADGTLTATPYVVIINLLTFLLPFSLVHALLSMLITGTLVWASTKYLETTATALIMLSPTFLVVAALQPLHLLAMALLLVALLKQKENPVETGILLVLFGLFSKAHALAALIIMAWLAARGIQRSVATISIASLSAALIFLPLPLFPIYWLPPFSADIFVHGMGGLFGYSIFFIVLSVMGIFFSWSKKREFVSQYALVAALTAATFTLGQQALIYLVFPLAFFASIAIEKVRKQQWTFPQVKRLTMLLIVLGLLFSFLSAAKLIVTMEPTTDSPYTWLGQQEDGVVATAPFEAYLVQALGKQPVMVTGREAMEGGHARQDLDDLFATRNLLTARDIMSRHEVSYVLITERMKAGAVWSEPEEGFLFLLRNNETFKKAYSDNGTTIWRIQNEVQ